ncbi:hypothetical protein AX27061_0971 [Achromobacter xylosoxidans NBRC 15126 = ATCC 27061]|nr:hypothetical protein AX27061_0971 [Achromobacter xylosoxidans NBRC 15126 = ATCC 27061]
MGAHGRYRSLREEAAPDGGLWLVPGAAMWNNCLYREACVHNVVNHALRCCTNKQYRRFI